MERLRMGWNVSQASTVTGRTRRSLYRLKASNPGFSLDWDDALEVRELRVLEFLKALKYVPYYKSAAVRAGLPYRYVLHRMETDAEFAEKVEEAQCHWQEKMLTKAMEMIENGSEGMLKFMMERGMPHLFGRKKPREAG